MRRKNVSLTSLTEDFSRLGLVSVDDHDSDAEELDEIRKPKKKSKCAKQGKRTGPDGKCYKPSKATLAKEKARRRKRRKKKKTPKQKKRAAALRKLRQSNSYGGDPVMESVARLASLVESASGEAVTPYDEYVECLENSARLSDLLADNFSDVDEERFEEAIQHLRKLEAMCESALDNMGDELAEDVTEDLDKGIEFIVSELREGMELWEHVRDEEPEEDLDEDEDSDIPDIFMDDDE